MNDLNLINLYIIICRLESDVIEKFIQLLIIDQDAKRKVRADGDLFCGMLHDIQNKRRHILFADTDLQRDSS